MAEFRGVDPGRAFVRRDHRRTKHTSPNRAPNEKRVPVNAPNQVRQFAAREGLGQALSKTHDAKE